MSEAPTVTCFLHGSFEDLLPRNAPSNTLTLDAGTPAEIVAHFGINPDLVQFVIVDGQYIDESQWQEALNEGAVVRLWPRLAGG